MQKEQKERMERGNYFQSDGILLHLLRALILSRVRFLNSQFNDQLVPSFDILNLQLPDQIE